jgi:O-antigen/teichoic acid export membrane protein
MWIDVAIVAVVLWFPLAFAVSSVRAATGSDGTVWVLRERAEVVTSAADCAAVLIIGRALGPWDALTPAVWGLALATALFALILAAWTWPALPLLRPGSRPARRWASVALELAFVALLLVLVT